MILLPNNANSNNCDDLIKRVIGLPGDTVQIKAGHASINGTPLDEPYTADQFCDRNCDGTWQLSPNQYFVLGDNRNNSSDSRVFGPIDRSLIVGKAWVRYWPLPDVSVIPRPSYASIPATPSVSPSPDANQRRNNSLN
ncbi:MAG: signal peptidase I [Aggregatilineales bacterium]